MSLPNKFNIRVYGLLINDQNEILISDEQQNDFRFSKFPGGGLEFGEGPEDCVIREFKEELNIEIKIQNHYYTTGFFQQSAFFKDHQIISIYYLVSCEQSLSISTVKSRFENLEDKGQVFRWAKIGEINIEELNFPIDRLVAERINKAH
jgi:mutator protein MutT